MEPASPAPRGRTFDIQPDAREALQLSAALWIGATAFIATGAIVVGNIRYVGEYLTLTTGLATAIAIAFGLFMVLKALAGRPRWLAYLVLPFAVVAASILQSVLDYGGFHLVNSVLPSTRLPAIDPAGWLMVFVINACLYTSNLTLLWVTSANRALRERELRLAKAEADGLRAEIQILRLKLSPHFLFNALGAASSLVATGRADQGEAMMTRLATFLRATFDVGVDDIAVRDELSIVEDYLEVERVRFPDRLRVEIEVDPEVEDALTPSLLLQPLVENAVKYAVGPSTRPVTVRVSATQVDNRLRLVVEDDGGPAAPTPPGTGLGQAASRSRLEMRHGDQAGFEAGPTQAGYRVVMTLPLTMAAPSSASPLPSRASMG